MRYPWSSLVFSFFASESAHLPTNSAEDPFFPGILTGSSHSPLEDPVAFILKVRF
jgi:hypothetical protein